ncbi:hydroxyisourate hydrolase [Paenibacillus rigui]|uniref:5-hydroxyisourate hydrolase n=1 Tax=Paenibacillus rigui TaxID=554312 RepID=A0A229UW15_9BACL|nr:hydroxyisourate hydrolase [Paenibacillus rigui]OXM87335.1 hydroxyisourate hydrolase [Paenibacillus rigui]
MAGRLTTHVLELSCGKPAEGMRLELYRFNELGERLHLLGGSTNADGRVDSPLLEGELLRTGVYELVFHVAEYYRAQQQRGGKGGEPEGASIPFLDEVPIRFGVGDADSHYHVPLLVAPGGYSTYRGS